MLERILDLLRDIPVGTIIFLAVLFWGFLGKKNKPKHASNVPSAPKAPETPSKYASDNRQTAQNSEWGHLDFGTPDDRYGDANKWGQTQYGFESTQWKSAFDDNDNNDEFRPLKRG